MTFLYLNIYMWVPSTAKLYSLFGFNIHYLSALKHLFTPSHHCILGLVSTFEGDDLFALEHLCVDPSSGSREAKGAMAPLAL